MIKRRGDLFTTAAVAIGHGVNCQGVMGSGIAVEFKRRYPKNYTVYHNACITRLLRAGETFVHTEEGTHIFNMATQDLPGANASYPWVMKAALDAAEQAAGRNIDRLAIPLIGCGIGGLDWPSVEQILLAVELTVPNFEFEVWKL